MAIWANCNKFSKYDFDLIYNKLEKCRSDVVPCQIVRCQIPDQYRSNRHGNTVKYVTPKIVIMNELQVTLDEYNR